jgi:iron complex outermembrane receptor protein
MVSYTRTRQVAALSLLFIIAGVNAAPQSNGDTNDEAIDEIIVSADFRERSANEMPVSVTVFDADQISARAVQHFEELINSVPNVNWSGDGHRARYFQIRGVGELEQYQGAPNPSVGFLIDDIDFSGIGTIATLFDMQQIEVLRGPQGSRYGANALAGLIYMQSTEPSADWNGLAQVQVADDDAYSAGLAFGGPIRSDESLLFRISAHAHQSNGYRDNPYLGRSDTNGRDETSVRGKVLWLPNDDWSIKLSLSYADLSNGYDAFALDNTYTVLSDHPGQDAQQSSGAALRIDWEGGSRTRLTSVTSAARSDIDFDFDADWGNAGSWDPVTYDYESFSDRRRTTLSQEFRLSSTDDGRIFGGTTEWLLGLYALNLDDELSTLNTGDYYDPFYDYADSLFDPFDSTYSAANIAMFGQLDYAISSATRLAFGLRVENRSSDYADSAGLTESPSESMSGGELSLTHDFSASLTAYVSVSKGYKAGGFNIGVVPPSYREYDQEQMWNIESGIKSAWLEDSLLVNASIFYSRRIDQQVRMSFQLVPGDPASFGFVTINAPKGDSSGLEADIRWLPDDSWDLYASVGLLHTEFGEFDIDDIDLSGRAQAHAPKFTISAGVSYQHVSGFFARIDATARDDFYFDVSHDQKSTAYELAHLRLGFRSENWTTQLWVRNVFDQDYAVRGFYFGNEPPDFQNTLYTRLGDPRQIGITIDRSF